MESGGLLTQAFVFLAAAVFSVPVAKRLGLGSVLGYLAAGALIGPFALGLVGNATDVMHFAEFGVVMMLFLVGLELRPLVVWRMRGPILGLGGLQVAGTAAGVAALSLAFGLPWQSGLAMGLILAMSSTAIVLQSLTERGLLRTEAGQSAFSVLLFQDIAVIPILAGLPLLALQGPLAGATPSAHGAPAHGVEALPGWLQALVIAGIIAAIVVGGRYLIRPAFRFVAQSRLREIFTATALLLVVGVALAMELVGLSPALGTFLAGVVLADSEYRHELESDIEPFKGLLLGLFFISVGSSIDFGLLAGRPGILLGGVAALVALKFGVLLALGIAFRLPRSERLLFAFALAQGGEFAFVLLAFATGHGVLAPEMARMGVVVVALSMAVAPLLLLLHERVLRPRLQAAAPPREPDAIDAAEAPVILAGFGRFGQIVGRLLMAQGVEPIVLDHDGGQVETIRRFGFRVFYGDASRVDLLHAAGAERARLLILAIDDPEKTLEIVATAKRHFPHLRILARATDLVHAYELLRLEVEGVERETFGSALEMGVAALRQLGFRAYQAQRAARSFRHHDESSMRELMHLRGDRSQYITRRTQQREELERRLQADLREARQEGDAAWDAMPPDAR